MNRAQQILTLFNETHDDNEPTSGWKHTLKKAAVERGAWTGGKTALRIGLGTTAGVLGASALQRLSDRRTARKEQETHARQEKESERTRK